MTQVSMIFNHKHASRGLIRATLMASIMCVASAFAQDGSATSSELVQRYAGQIGSVEVAERALAEVSKERSDIEQRFAAARYACYDNFFATSCVDKAKERRRLALEDVRKVEVEANTFIRRARVVERDKALEEKRLEREREEAERLQERAAQPAKMPKPPLPPVAAPKQDAVDPRVVKHEARLKQLEEQERAEAQQRARKAADYERKVQRAEERQREVAERKRQKEEERAGRSAGD